MIIHKLLICITAAIPLGFNLSLIMMPHISLYCALFTQTEGKPTRRAHVHLYALCIMYMTMFLHNTKSVHLLMCSLGKV